MRFLSLVLCIAVYAALSEALPTPSPDDLYQPKLGPNMIAGCYPEFKKLLLKYINDMRAAYGLARLTTSASLDDTAQAHSLYQVYLFSKQDSNYLVGENVYIRSTTSAFTIAYCQRKKYNFLNFILLFLVLLKYKNGSHISKFITT